MFGHNNTLTNPCINRKLQSSVQIMRYLGQHVTVFKGISTGTEQFLWDVLGWKRAKLFSKLQPLLSRPSYLIKTVPSRPSYLIKTVPSRPSYLIKTVPSHPRYIVNIFLYCPFKNSMLILSSVTFLELATKSGIVFRKKYLIMKYNQPNFMVCTI